MFYNRYESKMRAKAAMRGAYPHPMLITLIFLLATSVVSLVVISLVGNPFTAMLTEIAFNGLEPEDAFRYILTPGRMVVFYILNIILSLYLWVMNFGYSSYSLRLARGEQPGYRNLMDGFVTVGRALLVNFLTFLFTLLWGLLAMVPMILVLIVAIVSESIALIGLAYVLLLAAMVVEIIVSYRYRLAVYFLLDNPNMSALEGITRSKQAMRGHKGSLFVQDLSFIGWLFLVPFTLYILILWLMPYMDATHANFYDFVVHGEFGPTQSPLQQRGGPSAGGNPPGDDDRPKLTF